MISATLCGSEAGSRMLAEPGRETRLKDSGRESTAVPEFVVLCSLWQSELMTRFLRLSLSEDRLTGSLRSTGEETEMIGGCADEITDNNY